MISARLQGSKGASEKVYSILPIELRNAYILSVLTRVGKFRNDLLQSVDLSQISAKGTAVMGHIGCLHVNKVDIDPKTDTKRNK